MYKQDICFTTSGQYLRAECNVALCMLDKSQCGLNLRTWVGFKEEVEFDLEAFITMYIVLESLAYSTTPGFLDIRSLG